MRREAATWNVKTISLFPTQHFGRIVLAEATDFREDSDHAHHNLHPFHSRHLDGRVARAPIEVLTAPTAQLPTRSQGKGKCPGSTTKSPTCKTKTPNSL